MRAYGDTGLPSEPTPERRALAFHVIIRTRYFDDHLLTATRAGCTQVVLLAAGLDARAFRLDWPQGVQVYELDLPDVFAFKEQVLTETKAKASCERVVVPADLTTDWLPTLTARGFDPRVPTAWLIEGLLVYLSTPDAERVLATVTSLSAAGSRLAFERGSSTRAVVAEEHSGVTDLWQGGVTDPLGWLATHGWEPTVDDLAEVAARYGRPPSRPTASGFIRAVRP